MMKAGETLKMSFITWYPSCRRSDALALALNGNSHLIHFMRFKQPLHAPIKYIRQTIETFKRLNEDQPQVVFVASPPVFAVLAVWLYCRLNDCDYVIDAHTGVFDDRRWTWLSPVSRFLARRAKTTIVTNKHLQEIVSSWQADSLIIGDVPVDFSESTAAELGDGFHVTVINTFSPDEPLDEILSAARRATSVQFHITGSLEHARQRVGSSPPANVRFTGWLTDAEYAGQLAASDALMCLTTHNHTMQRGAYEAMALGKPLITSDWPLLREVFNAGTLHIDNSPDALLKALEAVKDRKTTMQREMLELAEKRRVHFDKTVELLRSTIASNTH